MNRTPAQAANCVAKAARRACSRPSIGAETACVSGIPMRAGPMTATVCSIAARLAP